MLIVMEKGATPSQIQRVVTTIEEMGYQARPMPGKQRTAVGLVGNDGKVDSSRLAESSARTSWKVTPDW